jgi:hypothetical protein
MSIAAIRDGLAENLAKIPGLRVAKEMPDNPSPPIAVLQLESINYDGAFQQGLTTYNFTIAVIVGRPAEREAQRRLDAYADSSGESSIKLAVQSDRTLDGAAYDVRVSDMRNIGAVLLGEATYLAADFVVTVYAN